MTRLTLKEWYAALCDLRMKYPDWDKYDENRKRQLANRHGYPYHTKANCPSGVFTKVFNGSSEQIDRQLLHWENEMISQYRTFRILDTVERPYTAGFFNMKYELAVTYRI